MQESRINTEAAPAVNWVWRAVVLAALTLMVPSLAYFSLFELFSASYSGMPKYLAEFLAAGIALFLSMLTLKVYNDREALGLDIKQLFPVRPFGRMWHMLLAGAVADLGLIAAFITLMLKYYPDYEGSTAIAKMWAGNDKWFFVLTSTFLYAACEEIFLRGLVFTYIKKHAGFMKALLVSSLIFSLMHVGRIWLALLMMFFSGIIYGLAYEKTRSLAVPCLLHGLHNSVLRVIGVLGLIGG
jgi:membrane protease YdiL (CAAX protease family)